MAADLTERKVIKAWGDLAAVGMLVIDENTAEILVRTFLRYDNVLAKPNLTKAFLRAHERVRSTKLLAAIDAELAKLLGLTPAWPDGANRSRR